MGMKIVGILLLPVLAWVMAGCDDRQDVKSYTVPGSPAATQPTAAIPKLPAAPDRAPVAESTAKWDAPSNWVIDPPKPMREAGYHVEEGNQRTDIVITRLVAGGFGMWPANVNRWRAQAGLEPIDEQAVQQLQPRTATVSGREARTYDFVGPDGPTRQRVVVTMITDGGTVWFIKMQGAAGIVEKNLAAYDALVLSFKFGQ